MILDYLILALAVSRLTRLVVHDSISERFRTFIWRRWPGTDTQFGDTEVAVDGKDTLGNRIGQLTTGVDVFRTSVAWFATTPRFVGNLISCHWCLSVWMAVAVWAGYWVYDGLAWWLLPLALSEVTGLLNDRIA